MTQGRAASKALFCSRSTSVGAAHGLTTPMAPFLLLMKNQQLTARRFVFTLSLPPGTGCSGTVRLGLPGPKQRPGHLSRGGKSLLREQTEAAALFAACFHSFGPTGLRRLHKHTFPSLFPWWSLKSEVSGFQAEWQPLPAPLSPALLACAVGEMCMANVITEEGSSKCLLSRRDAQSVCCPLVARAVSSLW